VTPIQHKNCEGWLACSQFAFVFNNIVYDTEIIVVFLIFNGKNGCSNI